MKTLLFSLFTFLTITTTKAQSVSDVSGDWTFYTIIVPEGTDAKKKQDATLAFSTIKMLLKADKTYNFGLMGLTETGNWTFKDKKIDFTTSENKTYSYSVGAFEKNMLTLIFNEKLSIVLSRVGANVPPPPSDAAPDTSVPKKTYVKANAVQLAKKWYLKGCPAPPNMTEKQKEDFGEMLAGSYIEFKAAGKCTFQLGDKKETEEWKLNTDKNGITTSLKNIPAALYFIKVTATELVITETDSYDDWIFSVVE